MCAIIIKDDFEFEGADKPKQNLRRGVLMGMIRQSASTLPLWVGKPGEE